MGLNCLVSGRQHCPGISGLVNPLIGVVPKKKKRLKIICQTCKMCSEEFLPSSQKSFQQPFMPLYEAFWSNWVVRA
jgi:hypothetical protein